MNYKLKIIINGVEVLEEQKIEKVDGAEYSAPSILDVRLQNNATLKTMEIGATTCDCLTFTMLNPFSQSFDGQKVEFLVKPITTVVESLKAKIEAAVGFETTTNAINEAENNTNVIPAEEEGEPLTEEELEDVEATAEANVEDTFNQLEGEADATTPEAVTDSEWHRIGVYYVQNQETLEDNKIRLTCYDGFAQLNGIWIPMNREGTTAALFEDLRSQIFNTTGIFVEPFEFGEEPLKWNTMSSYRTALGYFAGLAGGFVGFDEDGDVAINFYGFTDNILIKEELLAYTEDSAGEMLLTEISCNTSLDGINESILESGAGQGISFNNPYMTQEGLDAILADYTGVRFTGGNIKTIWNESLIAGEFVKVFTAEEYDNYLRLKNAYNAGETDLKESINSLGTVMLISSQVITFGGDAVSNITSVCSSEAAKENVQTSPTDQKFRNVYANSLTVEALEAGTAKIKDAYIESINGSKINNSAIFARALSHEMVSTLLGVNVYYQADEPTPEKVGDIWYRTVVDADFDPNTDIIKQWDGSAWVTMPEAAGIFAANSVTAQEIAANTITANNINMDNLQTSLARIGATDGRHVQIDEDSVDIMNGSDNLASFSSQIDEYGRVTSIISVNKSGSPMRLSSYIDPNKVTENAFVESHGANNTRWSRLYSGIKNAHSEAICSTSPEQSYVKLEAQKGSYSVEGNTATIQVDSAEYDSDNVKIEDSKISLDANKVIVANHDISYCGECVSLAGNSGEVTLSTSAANYLTGRCQIWQTSDNYDKVYAVNLNPATILVQKKGMYIVKMSAYFTTNFTANDIIHINLERRQSDSATWVAMGFAGYVGRATNASWYQRVDCVGYLNLDVGDMVRMTCYNQNGARGRINVNGNTNLQIIKIY